MPPLLSLCSIEFTPWQLNKPVFNLNLTCYAKESTPRELLRAEFRNIINAYDDAVFIYTDGSKKESGVGCAFVVGDSDYSWSLQSFASIFFAELYAIFQALLFIRMSHNGNNFVIVTDSLSALKSLQAMCPNEPMVRMVGELLHVILLSGKQIVFIWVPGHIGIEGNERADKAAGHGVDGNSVDVSVCRHKDVIRHLKSLVYNKWQNDWQHNESFLRRIKPLIKPWNQPIIFNRLEQVKLARLHIGHTQLTSGYLLKREPRPVCLGCEVHLTVMHILLDCELYANERQLHNISCLDDAYANPVNLIEFFKCIDLFHQL
nr:uncharacterized protein LOC111417282 [Onthophagus taurus]